MADLQITTAKAPDDIVIINLKGILDVTNCHELQTVINNLLGHKVYRLVVDLSELEYISSAGVGVLIESMGTAQEHHGAIVLVNPRDEVKTVLDLLRITTFCRLVKNRQSAFKVFED